jgi:hypothetical protein
MSQPQTGLDQLPYIREYVEQILRPRVAKVIEDVRGSLTEAVWTELLTRIAREQGSAYDAAGLQKLRTIIEQGLSLRLTAHVVANFESAAPGAAAPSNGHPMDAVRVEDERENVAVVESGLMNNPLARAMGNVRRPAR